MKLFDSAIQHPALLACFSFQTGTCGEGKSEPMSQTLFACPEDELCPDPSRRICGLGALRGSCSQNLEPTDRLITFMFVRSGSDNV